MNIFARLNPKRHSECTHYYCWGTKCRFKDKAPVVIGVDPAHGPDLSATVVGSVVDGKIEIHEMSFDGRIDDLRADPDYRREDYELRHRHDEDHRLDDPRHGQAAGINRDNRGRE